MEMEYEAKALIDEKQFEELLKTLPISQVKEQTNVYFETKDEYFKQRNSALRMRSVNDTFKLMLKVREEHGNEEYNFPITRQEYSHAVMTGKVDLSKFKLPFGLELSSFETITMHTTRYVCIWNHHTIEIDKTEMGLVTDFEIEVEAESMDQANDIMASFCKHFNLRIKKSYPKIARYYMYNT